MGLNRRERHRRRGIVSTLHRHLREQASARDSSLDRFSAEPSADSLRHAATDQTYAPLAASATRLFAGSLEGVVLFGSEAWGEAWKEPDIDLLIVLGEAAEITRGLYTRWERELGTGACGVCQRVAPQFLAMPWSVEDAVWLCAEAATDGIVFPPRPPLRSGRRPSRK